jgi:hypothetical protein
MITSRSAPVVALLAFALSATCGAQQQSRKRTTAVACDSARAARIVLDSLARLDPFPSAVYGLTRDTLGMRFVTKPDQTPERSLRMAWRLFM